MQSLLEPVVIAITFVCGIIASFISTIIKDAILKNTLKTKIAHLEELESIRNRIDDRQDTELTRLREEQIMMREKLTTIRERIDSIYDNDIKVMKEMLQDLQQSSASLEATLKGLTGWLKRVDGKLDQIPPSKK